MKTYKKIIFTLLALIFVMTGTVATRASVIPSLSLTSEGGDTVQVNVVGDPSSAVYLYYSSSGASTVSAVVLGSTNSAGDFSNSISSGSYDLTSTDLVYAEVDGQESASYSWPYTAPINNNSAESFSLNTTSPTLSIGQVVTITSSLDNVYISNNSNSSVASASISDGNEIVIDGNSDGSTNITVCNSGDTSQCDTIYVTVNSSGSSSGNFSLSQSNVSLSDGQSQVVTMYGSGNYYISSNSNTGVVSSNISGDSITLYGENSGTSDVTVCQNGGGCSTIYVTVGSSESSSSISFSQSSVSLGVNQNETISINGPGSYYLGSYANPSIASATINGDEVTINAYNIGTTNINVCSSAANNCASVSVSVVGENPTTVSTVPGCIAGALYSSTTGQSCSSGTTNSGISPTISSLTISSSDASNGFANTGSSINFSFNTNEQVNSPYITVAGTRVYLSGSGEGPYTGSYLITGSEAQPIPVIVYLTDYSGNSSQVSFSIGSQSSVANTTSTPTSSTTSNSSSGEFQRSLYFGISGDDVTALQQRLTNDGFFSGPITGYFGSLTQAAVEQYQTAHAIDPIGVVGPLTMALLNTGV